MNDENYLKQLLKEKLTDSSEIELHLFEYCNLACSFCGQDHDSKEGMNTIREKAAQVIDFMDDSPHTSHTVNIMGGEIFNDDIPPKIFDDYMAFYKTIRSYCLNTGQTVRFNWVTNLIFHKNIEHVERLLYFTENSFLSTSYDFAGRGLDINRMLTFKANLERFKDRVGVVGFVMTRPSLRKLIADKDKYFKEVLYPNFPLYFDWYVPENSADKMMPSEQEILDGLLFMAEHYPNLEPVASMLNNESNKMTCYSLSKVTILPTGKEVTCRYMEYDKDKFINEVDYLSNANIVQAHLDRHNCLSCEYFSRCQFRCFVQADWRDQERLPECFIKTFFDKTIGKDKDAQREQTVGNT